MNGDVRVIRIFFVFSAYFIAPQFQRYGETLAGVFRLAAKRLLRLWPPYALVTTAIALVLAFGLPEFPDNTSSWFKSWYSVMPTLSDWLKNLALLDAKLNSPTWILWYKATFMIFALPLYWLTRRVGFIYSIFAWVVLIILDVIHASNFDIFNMVYRFYPGIILFVHGWRLPKVLIPLPIILTPILLDQRYLGADVSVLYGLVCAIGAVAITSALQSKRMNLLPFSKVYFEFFLVHFFVMYAVYFVILPIGNAMAAPNIYRLAIFIVSVTVSLALAYSLKKFTSLFMARRQQST